MSAKSDDSAFTMVAAVVVMPFIIATLIPVLLWFGWAISILWGWFVAPVFGLPAITISQAAGLSLVLSAMRAKLSAPKDETSFALKALTVLIGPPMAVGIGWVVKWIAL
jgi:hypothetical protein